MKWIYNTPDMLCTTALIDHLIDDKHWYWLSVRNKLSVDGVLGCFINNPGIRMLATIKIKDNCADSLNIIIEDNNMGVSNIDLRHTIEQALNEYQLSEIVENSLYTLFNSLSVDIDGLLDYLSIKKAWRIKVCGDHGVYLYCLPCMAGGVMIKSMYMCINHKRERSLHAEIYGQGLSYYMNKEHVSVGELSERISRTLTVPIDALSDDPALNEAQRNLIKASSYFKNDINYRGSELLT